jgi:hypothetical protein
MTSGSRRVKQKGPDKPALEPTSIATIALGKSVARGHAAGALAPRL